MKKIRLTIALIAAAAYSYGQTDFQKELARGIAQVDTAKTAIGYQNAQTHFETLAKTNRSAWLAHYYAAYSTNLAAIKSKAEPEQRDALFDKAMAHIAKADSLQPKSSEIYALKAYIVFMQMAVYPTKRAMEMIPQSNMLLDKALAFDPQNPRAYLLKGQISFYVPEMFGGSKEEAKKSLLTAKEKFEAAVRPDSYLPSWGKERCAELLSEL